MFHSGRALTESQAVYQSLLHLTWVENLLAAVKALFIKRYATELKKPAVTSLDCADFVYTFDALVTKLDTGSTKRVDDFQSSVTAVAPALPPGIATTGGENSGLASASRAKQPPQPQSREVQTPNETACDTTPLRTPDTTRPSTPSQASHLVTGKGGPGKASRRVRKAALVTAPVACGDEAATGRSKPGQNKAKQMRRWDADGFAVVGDEDVQLDYSAAPLTNINDDIAPNVDEIPADRMGRRTGKGQFALKDLEDEVDAILASTKDGKASTPARAGEAPSGTLESASFKISSFFRNIVGGRKLTEADLRQPLQQMQNHLLEKNVAREAADRLCASVEADLLDQTTASFTSIDKTIHESMIKALTRMLTPTSSLDLVRDISRTIEGPSARPYVISIVGVNGVGKSTNLSKIAYFLLQNQFRVLVVAGDTFRSGAVEQLRVHVRNLSELSRRENVGTVELFEKGYGKDAATVARDAVSSATAAGSDGRILFDVVLIDTAGRRHNDSRLMSSLTKFGQLANPDKIFMVGEALVGTDSVAQARNFAKEFVDTKVRSIVSSI